MLSREIREQLRTYGTPFYLYDMDLLRRTLKAVRDESQKYGFKVHYAMKANFESRIVGCVKEYGLGVDCVSGNEVRHAVDMGFPASGIAFAGVGKSDAEITYAVEQGIFAFNVESKHELEVINTIAADMGRVAHVAFRLNPDVDPKTHKYISTGKSDNKFGISYQEIEQIVEQLPDMKNIEVAGLHFHIGSQISDMTVFEELCTKVNERYAWFKQRGFTFSHINVGGGLAIDYNDPDANPIPDFAKYFAIFADNLKLDEGVEVHFELGRSIVGQCGELISRVLYNKTTSGGKNFVIIDASMTELIRPALYQAHHAIENIDGGIQTNIYTVAGPVCESSDVFEIDIELPLMERGNLVSLKSTGAYGTAMASRYNMRDLPQSVYSDTL